MFKQLHFVSRMMAIRGLGILSAMLLLSPANALAQSPVGVDSNYRYFQSNPNASSASRYAFLLPPGVDAMLQQPSSLTFVFTSDLDVVSRKRSVKLCYDRKRSANRLSHSQCVERLPVTINVTAGPGEDTVTLVFSQPPDLGRPIELWIDMINPSAPGRYPVQLRFGDSRGVTSQAITLGHWSVQIQHPDFDSPGSAE